MTAPGIGHNSGRVSDPGESWRRHAWTRARADLLPTLPIEVVRLRVRRAAELGLPYKTYAGIRASTGHDLIGFLFSSNALRVLRDGQALPPERAAHLAGLVRAARIGLAQGRVTPAALAAVPQIDAAHAAPAPLASWAATRDHLRAILRAEGHPADQLLLVGETALEREWSEIGRLAGFLSADRVFAATA